MEGYTEYFVRQWRCLSIKILTFVSEGKSSQNN